MCFLICVFIWPRFLDKERDRDICPIFLLSRERESVCVGVSVWVSGKIRFSLKNVKPLQVFRDCESTPALLLVDC